MVLIDDNGTKWFAARWGLYIWRFDESGSMKYEIPMGEQVMDMALDTDGHPWVATFLGYELYYLEGSRFHSLLLPPTFSFPLALTFDCSGHLWVGGWNDGAWIARYDGEPDQWDDWAVWAAHWPNEPDWAPQAFATAPDGRVWFVTTGYGGRGSRLCGSVQNYAGAIDFAKFIPEPKRNYVDLAISDTARVWLISNDYNPATGGNTRPVLVYSDDMLNWSVLEYPDLPCLLYTETSLAAVGGEGMWLGLNQGGFWYDNSDWRWIDIGVPVNDIAVDPTDGDVWFGTNDGVYVMRGGPEAWPPVWIELEAAQLAHPDGATPSLLLLGSAEFQMDLRLDLYVALELPDGTLLFAPSWTPSMAPLVSGLEVPIGLNIEDLPLVTLDTAGVPAGRYRWFAACTHAGSMEFASNIASCEWQFE